MTQGQEARVGAVEKEGVEVTPDGYLVVKPSTPTQTIRGIQCGICGMRFEYNQAYGYYCPDANCPVQTR